MENELLLALSCRQSSGPLFSTLKPEAAPAQAEKKAEPAKPLFQPTEVKTSGAVTIRGKRIAYRAVAGTLVIHSKDWSDTDAIEAAGKKPDNDDEGPKAEASMFTRPTSATALPQRTAPSPSSLTVDGLIVPVAHMGASDRSRAGVRRTHKPAQ